MTKTYRDARQARGAELDNLRTFSLACLPPWLVQDLIGRAPARDSEAATSLRRDATLALDVVIPLLEALPDIRPQGWKTSDALKAAIWALVKEGPYGVARGSDGLAPWQVRVACQLLSDPLDTEVELSTVAAECALSLPNFCRRFRASMGRGPARWRIAARVERAKERLCDGQSSLVEIALALGFCDQSHFTRVFSKEVGISPGRWRALHCR
jgi:AraC-like DNA-binding protein